MTKLVRTLAAQALALAALFTAPTAAAIDTGDIVVASVKGDVQVTMRGAPRAVHAGSVLELPATVQTGSDGAIELRQGATSVSVGPDTLLEFPALQAAGGPIDRIVQPRGNVFYGIGKRAARKLRVETPYLVGVVKGTQFNVAAQDGATVISLFEGLLEIRASDDSSVIELHAGEVASRKRGDAGIGVIRMDAGNTPAQRAPAGGDKGGNIAPRAPRQAPPEVRDESGDSLLAEQGQQLQPVAVGRDSPGAAPLPVTVEPRVPVADVGAAVDVNAGDVDVDVGAGVTAGVGQGANLDVAAGAPQVPADVSVDVAVDAGSVAVTPGAGVNVGVSVSVDPSLDLNSGTGALAAGPPNVDLGVSADVDVDVNAGLGLGQGNGASASVDVNAGAQAGSLGAGVAVDVGAGGGAATVDLGVNLGGANLGVDVGLGANNPGLGSPVVDTPAATVDVVIDDVDTLIKGLLRKPGK